MSHAQDMTDAMRMATDTINRNNQRIIELLEEKQEWRQKYARLEAIAEAAEEVSDDLHKAVGERCCENASDSLQPNCNRCWPCVIWKAINNLDAAKGGG